MNNPKIKITVAGLGEMVAELYPEKAPATVENFLKLVKNGFYEGLIFHRVISGFMIQGGGFDAEFKHKDADAIKGEFAANGFGANDIRHTRGVLSMARTSDPNSASSQFFIMHQNSPHLDGQYAGFGAIIEGIEVVDKIADCDTRSVGWYDDVPVSPIVIEKMEIL